MGLPHNKHSDSHMSPHTSRNGRSLKIPRIVKLMCSYTLSYTQTMLINLGTLPYYRFFNQNTYAPITRISKIVTDQESDEEIVSVLRHWRTRKLYEMHFIQVASAVLAGGVIGCLQWNSLTNTFWLGPALWYCSLVLSILSVLLSSSQAFIFDSLNVPAEEEGSPGDYRRYLLLILKRRDREIVGSDEERASSQPLEEWVPRWRMIFTWQCSMMFMAYVVCFFLIGLTLFICTALINGERNTGAAKTAYFYLVVAALTVGIFMYSSFWGYRYVDLDRDQKTE